MAVSELRLIKRYWEFYEKKDISHIPTRTRGIYVLFEKLPSNFDVVYIGMSGGEKTGIRGRLGKHSRRKVALWTHFSVLEVWDNIREEEVRELEGILRHIYRKDSHANKLGIQKSFRKLAKISKRKWMK